MMFLKKQSNEENMAVNSGVEGNNTCECGRVWLLSKRSVPQRDKDDISCTCGKTLVSWNGGCVWTAKLIKDIEGSIGAEVT
jgi:hypothetical protein